MIMDLSQALTHIINTFAGTAAALIAIAGVVAKIKPIGVSIKRFLFAELYASNEKQDRRLDNLELQQLKQIICDRRLPDGERLNAGDEYIKRGGNGEIKMIYESIKEAAKKRRLEERERFEKEQTERRGTGQATNRRYGAVMGTEDLGDGSAYGAVTVKNGRMETIGIPALPISIANGGTGATGPTDARAAIQAAPTYCLRAQPQQYFQDSPNVAYAAEMNLWRNGGMLEGALVATPNFNIGIQNQAYLAAAAGPAFGKGINMLGPIRRYDDGQTVGVWWFSTDSDGNGGYLRATPAPLGNTIPAGTKLTFDIKIPMANANA
jgi:hypothetical protein